jgi:hypothetical protein
VKLAVTQPPEAYAGVERFSKGERHACERFWKPTWGFHEHIVANLYPLAAVIHRPGTPYAN